MKKKDTEKKSEGIWFERSKHWCEYPVAKGVRHRTRGTAAVARRKAKRVYAKLVMYGNNAAGGFKGWLKEQVA